MAIENEERRPWWLVGTLLSILTVLVGGTWLSVKMTTDHLLYRNATDTAREWANFLATNVGDLEQIAAGETPSSASMAFFRGIGRFEDVYRYVIFNRYGYSILISSNGKVTPVEVSDYSEKAARSLKNNEAVVDARVGVAPGEPRYFAEAFVPVSVAGRPIAIVASYVDQSNDRDAFLRTSLLAALSLCGLTGLSFGVPAIAWYRRTREKQQADRRIQFLAHHDILTGLANRARVIERLEAALAVLPSTGGMVALHFIDIDHFKQVNDALGHDGGDFLLQTIGERLRTMVRIEDMVARLGGDEFVVVQTGVTDKAQAEAFAARAAAVLSAVSYFREQEIRSTYTIGVALAPADGSTAERLLKSADLALYAGKAAGRNCIRFFVP
jgi:diguanylate cyclase (GGDEF)-like protein